jgi:DNA-binding CsgD family transcriptional regulator/tetratricopeptide (TPR) repeat protein
LTTDTAATIADICLRLDGLPLAIELAAARVKVLAPQTLLARLDHRLHVLTGGARDLPERQQTLRNTLAWSYELLTTQEQHLFQRLSVFVGGCTLEAIESVCAALDDEADHVLEGVASLIDKSLLYQTEQEGAEARLVMLETIREYGLEALEGSGEMELTRQAHAAHYLGLAEQAERALDDPQQAEWLERLEREYDNLRAAMQWSLEPGKEGHRREMALRLGGALRRLWIVHGHWSEGRNFLERALAESKGVPAAVQVKAIITAANLANMQADTDRAEVLAEKSRELCQELGDTRGLALSLRLLAVVATRRGDLAAARSLNEEALMLFREVGDQKGAGLSLSNLGWLAIIQGEYAKGRALFEESLAMHRQVGNKEGMARSLIALAVALINTEGDPATIRALLEESLALSQEVGNREGIETFFFLSGQLALSQGDIATARELAEKSLVINREIGNREDIAYSLFLLARVEARQGHYAAACALYEQCLAMAIEGNSKWNIDLFMQGLAGVVAAQGEPAWAARLYGADEAFRDANSRAIIPVYRAEYEHSVAATRAQLGEQAFAATWAEGRTMTPEQALAARGPMTMPTLALAEPSAVSHAPKAATYPDGLTTREVEVLRLLAQGLTSAQIAEQLVIGLVTVNSHVRSIYSKLEVTSRSAATRYALEHHLL